MNLISMTQEVMIVKVLRWRKDTTAVGKYQ